MNQLPNAVLGAIILVVLLPCIYFAARIATAIGDAWGAYRLAPLAPLIDGIVDRNGPYIVGKFGGYKLRVTFCPKEPGGSGDDTINAFRIHVLDVPGQHHWCVPFEATGRFGFGFKAPHIEAQHDALRERLKRSGALQLVESVSKPSAAYVTVVYDPRQRTLTYVNDVSPHTIPSREDFAKQLALVAKLIALNAKLNPPASL